MHSSMAALFLFVVVLNLFNLPLGSSDAVAGAPLTPVSTTPTEEYAAPTATGDDSIATPDAGEGTDQAPASPNLEERDAHQAGYASYDPHHRKGSHPHPPTKAGKRDDAAVASPELADRDAHMESRSHKHKHHKTPHPPPTTKPDKRDDTAISTEEDDSDSLDARSEHGAGAKSRHAVGKSQHHTKTSQRDDDADVEPWRETEKRGNDKAQDDHEEEAEVDETGGVFNRILRRALRMEEKRGADGSDGEDATGDRGKQAYSPAHHPRDEALEADALSDE